MDYWIYLLDSNQRIAAAEKFDAEDDSEAGELALALHASCADAYATCEVWRDGSCLTSSSHTGARQWERTLSHLRHGRRQQLRQLVEQLDRGFGCAQESRSLAEAYQALRDGSADIRGAIEPN